MNQYVSDFAGMPSNLSVSLSDQGLLWIFICVLVGVGKVLVTNSPQGTSEIEDEGEITL